MYSAQTTVSAIPLFQQLPGHRKRELFFYCLIEKGNGCRFSISIRRRAYSKLKVF